MSCVISRAACHYQLTVSGVNVHSHSSYRSPRDHRNGLGCRALIARESFFENPEHTRPWKLPLGTESRPCVTSAAFCLALLLPGTRGYCASLLPPFSSYPSADQQNILPFASPTRSLVWFLGKRKKRYECDYCVSQLACRKLQH